MVDLVRPSGLSVVAAITCNTVRTFKMLDHDVDLDQFIISNLLIELYLNVKLLSNTVVK